MKYPLQHNEDGNFLMPIDEIEEIEHVLRVILTTVPGQHPRDPEFGNHAILLLFDNYNDDLHSHVTQLMKYDVERWEKRVQILDVIVEFSEQINGFRVQVAWDLKTTAFIVPRKLEVMIGGRKN